jgi:hypothetical protein
MTGQAASQPVSRFQVKGGFNEGVPFVEVVDNLACAGFTWDIATASQMASGISGAVAALLGMIAEHQQRQEVQKKIVVAKPNGRNLRAL